MQATATSRLRWITLQFNYVYGHALDTSSNGGFDAFGINPIGQINPQILKQNYGNADYDTRHYISSNYTIKIPHFAGPKVLVDNWVIAGTIFHNSGYPFSVADGIHTPTYGVGVRWPSSSTTTSTTTAAARTHVTTSCDFASHFTSATDYGQQRRNQLYGPNYTDFDTDISKGFKLPRWEKAELKVAAQFFNTFNHTNFQLPYADVADGSSDGPLRCGQHANLGSGRVPRRRCFTAVDPVEGYLCLLTESKTTTQRAPFGAPFCCSGSFKAGRLARQTRSGGPVNPSCGSSSQRASSPRLSLWQLSSARP